MGMHYSVWLTVSQTRFVICTVRDAAASLQAHANTCALQTEEYTAALQSDDLQYTLQPGGCTVYHKYSSNGTVQHIAYSRRVQ